MIRSSLAALLGALALVAPAHAGSWMATGSSPQGPVSFRIHSEPWSVWTTEFRAKTRCGTVRVAGPLYWWETRSAFSYRSDDARTALYIYNYTGPDGGGYGWVRTEKAGCASGHLKITLDEG